MTPTIYTLADANRALPLVRSIVADAVRVYADAKAAIRTLDVLRGRQEAGFVGDEIIARQEEALASLLSRLRVVLDELEALGLRLRDYERGVVDFPAAAIGAEGPLVYCWALGEDAIAHWHVDGEEYEARRLLSSVG